MITSVNRSCERRISLNPREEIVLDLWVNDHIDQWGQLPSKSRLRPNSVTRSPSRSGINEELHSRTHCSNCRRFLGRLLLVWIHVRQRVSTKGAQ
ncbi:Hypothetical predicted protein [Olea europaea subsp. europaea]|uniref:Uncharacterized protein n=1 Tax=Olea europaea subsp. europaea TaxID=158383 RepID=A0A8S0PQ71_OLEEU|nr:Hypothetical predicted protein [Olea europaea subsp. europaea]